MEHASESLIRQGMIDAESSSICKAYLGYIPYGMNSSVCASMPWQYPKNGEKTLADIEGDVMFRTTIDNQSVPVRLDWGKRGALGQDIRRLRVRYANGSMTMEYRSSSHPMPNFLNIHINGQPDRNYFLDGDPYQLMLIRMKSLWSGSLQGEGGLSAQLVNAFLIEDLYNSWMGKPTKVFIMDSRAAQFPQGKDLQTLEFAKIQRKELEKIDRILNHV
jgi:hypothetical protein